MRPFCLILAAVLFVASKAAPTTHADNGVKFVGVDRNGIEIFLGIPYGQDTGGQNRFKPPRPYLFAPDTVVDATQPGRACPQQLGQWNTPLTLLNVTEGSTSEDCLNLNIARPKLNSTEWERTVAVPVMVWIHGGGFWVGSNVEPTHQPDALVRKSYDINSPIIHVAINYRLGIFGFAQSDALKMEGSMNAGLRDQRLAIEWVRDHIHFFGGDASRITISGQSSGGLAVGMQVLAYGGEEALPFRSAICQSQALEPGITGNFTGDAMTKVVARVGCNPNNGSVHTPEVIACLRTKDTQDLFNASASSFVASPATNLGDVWLPAVDEDFLPAAPSELIAQGRFGNATMILGWAEDDVTPFTNFSIVDRNDTLNFISDYLPKLPHYLLDPYSSDDVGVMTLYPENDFVPPSSTNLTANFYLSATVLRDILMVCPSILFAHAMHEKGWNVFLYNWNQTLLEPILRATWHLGSLGVVHTSEFPYIFANLSHYDIPGYLFNLSQSDYDLADRASSTWIDFAWTGTTKSGRSQGKSLQNWRSAYFRASDSYPPPPGFPHVFTVGGPSEGLSALDGPASLPEIRRQRLVERCAFFNDPRVIRYLQY